MTTLLAATTATSAEATEGNVKAFLTNLREVIAEFLGTDTTNKAAALATLGAALNGSLAKSTNYTVVAADRGKVINASGTITINITAAATLGDGFAFSVWNVGSNTVTIDPNLTELINGATTLSVLPGKMAMIYCNGTAFVAVAGFALAELLALDGAGSELDADKLDGQHGSYYATASALSMTKDVGSGGAGCFRMCTLLGGPSIPDGGTTAGSNLSPLGSGTWRNVSGRDISNDSVAGMFQRIS